MTENPLTLTGANPFCCRKDCGKMSDFEIGFKIWASPVHKVKVPSSAAEMFLPVTVCDSHSKEIVIAEWLHAEGRKLISNIFAQHGKTRPDFGTAELVLKPMKRGQA